MRTQQWQSSQSSVITRTQGQSNGNGFKSGSLERSSSKQQEGRAYNAVNFPSIGVQGIGSVDRSNTNITLGNPVHVGFIVVSKEEIEAPWREECEYLQSLIQELQFQLANNNQNQELINENKSLKDQLQLARNDIARLQRELRDAQDIIASLRARISEMELRISQLEEELSSSSSTESVTYLTSELSTWKTRYIETNRKLNEESERFTLCQAELEALRANMGGAKETQVVTTTRTVKTSSQSGSTTQSG